MSPAERKYQREWKRRQSEARDRAANRPARTCQHLHGRKRCGARLEDVIDRMTGRVFVRCPACERRRRGICRLCPRPVTGLVRKSLYCAECRARRQREHMRAWLARNAKRQRERMREWYARLTPEQRAERVQRARERRSATSTTRPAA